MQWLIVNASGTDLNTSVQLSMKAVSFLIILYTGFTYCASYDVRLRELLYESFYLRQSMV